MLIINIRYSLFIINYSKIDISQLALQRKQYAHLSDDEWRWMLQQVEGRQRTADKLPTFAAIDDWWYPVRLSCEQCSSELTARYKAELIQALPNTTFADLTGGYGVDTLFLSTHFSHTDYVEQNAELCRIMQHNKDLWSRAQQCNTTIDVHNTSAEYFLQHAGQYDLIFVDPARRDSHGGKVFRLEDCTPNMVTLLPSLLQHLTPNGRIMLKLSPMLDITQALSSLTTHYWQVFVVAVKNEVKEVLLLSQPTEQSTITAIDLAVPEQSFCFNPKGLKDLKDPKDLKDLKDLTSFSYLYEPNAAILKAGGYRHMAERFGVHKLDNNTHLFVSDQVVDNFPGRVWQIDQLVRDRKDLPSTLTQANILTRNHPLTPDQLKKKLHLRDGGAAYIIGARVAGKPVLFLAHRL
ncbi:MAG: SAM-dependent methyltransferase [Paludibacteraceae bacterium]|nr:SAM-dependent methyltransferase [Paludibacteraceae bacterium]